MYTKTTRILIVKVYHRETNDDDDVFRCAIIARGL